MNTLYLVKALTGLVAALAAVGTVVVAFMGLSTWRRQLKGAAEYELAKQLLRNAYRVKDRVVVVRTNQLLPGEHDPDGEQEEVYQLVLRRIEALRKASSDLRVNVVEAQVLWGNSQKLKNAYNHLIDYNARIDTAIEHFQQEVILGWANKYTKDDKEVLNLQSKHEKPEKYEAEIDEIIQEFERFIRPHLRK